MIRARRRSSWCRSACRSAAIALAVLLLVAPGRAQGPGSITNLTILAKLSGTPLSCSDLTTRCVPSEYATPQAAWAASSAGDVIWIAPGTYAAIPAQSTHNGTSGNTITFLANGAVTACSMAFSNNSYIRVIGITFNGGAAGCSSSSTLVTGAGTNTGLEFWNDTVTNTTGAGYKWDIVGTGARCDKCIWIGGSVSNIGNPSSSTGLSRDGDDSYIGYVTFSNICYIGIGPSGARGRFIHNDFSGMVQCGVTHPDNFYIQGLSGSLGWTNNLVEATFVIGTNTASDNKFHHQQNQSAVAWNDDVYRWNVATQLGSGVYSVYSTGTGDSQRIRWYNNTWVNDVRAAGGASGCGSGRADNATIVSVYFYNTLLQDCWSIGITSAIDNWGFAASTGTLTVTEDYNLAFHPGGTLTFSSGWNAQPHRRSNIDPKLHDIANNDFTLDPTSGAIGAGGPLSAANGAGSSSTTLTVAAGSGSFFIGDDSANLPAYGGLLVPGDFITVGTCTSQVVSVSGDTLTLATPCSWSNAAPIWFGTSSTVDIGAYPFKSTGYALTATKTRAGSTVTITPNDASLARFAVVFENNMPKCIASAANGWACSVGSGVITALIYPRYASLTQAVVVN